MLDREPLRLRRGRLEIQDVAKGHRCFLLQAVRQGFAQHKRFIKQFSLMLSNQPNLIPVPKLKTAYFVYPIKYSNNSQSLTISNNTPTYLQPSQASNNCNQFKLYPHSTLQTIDRRPVKIGLPDYMKMPHLGNKNRLSREKQMRTLHQEQSREEDLRFTSGASFHVRTKSREKRYRLYLSIHDMRRGKQSPKDSVIDGW